MAETRPYRLTPGLTQSDCAASREGQYNSSSVNCSPFV